MRGDFVHAGARSVSGVSREKCGGLPPKLRRWRLHVWNYAAHPRVARDASTEFRGTLDAHPARKRRRGPEIKGNPESFATNLQCSRVLKYAYPPSPKTTLC